MKMGFDSMSDVPLWKILLAVVCLLYLSMTLASSGLDSNLVEILLVLDILYWCLDLSVETASIVALPWATTQCLDESSILLV